MIPFEFEYYKPSTISEAIEQFFLIHNRGGHVIYYSGGTEFITFARVNKITADAVIDLKGIPECTVLERQQDELVIGTAVTLNHIIESNLFPFLGGTVKQIADHTSRNKITIGGNMNSRLMYREGILPLIVADAKVRIAGQKGEKVVPLTTIFDQELKMDTGTFIVQILVDALYINLPFVSLKKTRMTKVGYPLVSLAALTKDNKIQAAFSGICAYPFRLIEIEDLLNDSTFSINERISQVVATLPSPIVDDIQGSAEYREFVLKNVLYDALDALEVAK